MKSNFANEKNILMKSNKIKIILKISLISILILIIIKNFDLINSKFEKK